MSSYLPTSLAASSRYYPVTVSGIVPSYRQKPPAAMGTAAGQISGSHSLVPIHVQKAGEALKGHLLRQRQTVGLGFLSRNQRKLSKMMRLVLP